jgi:hypothetical protein
MLASVSQPVRRARRTASRRRAANRSLSASVSENGERELVSSND